MVTQIKPNNNTGFSILTFSLSIPAIINNVAIYNIPKTKYTNIDGFKVNKLNFIEKANKILTQNK